MIATVHSISDLWNYGYVALDEHDEECAAIVHYSLKQDNKCHIDSVKADEGVPKEEISKMIRIAFEDIVESGFLPIPMCEEARAWYDEEKEKMRNRERLIDILPNVADGDKEFNNDDLYDLFIEYPVREACKSLNDMGFTTIMSSANREDAKTSHIPEKEGKDLFIGPNMHFSIGNGYAWIMIDYKSLSEENKRIMDSLNSGEIPIELTIEERKRLEANCRTNNVLVSQSELVKYYRVISEDRGMYSESPLVTRELPPYFRDHCNKLYHKNSLSYHGGDYGAVVIRYPINEDTKSEDVINYFRKIISVLKDNKHKIRFV